MSEWQTPAMIQLVLVLVGMLVAPAFSAVVYRWYSTTRIYQRRRILRLLRYMVTHEDLDSDPESERGVVFVEGGYKVQIKWIEEFEIWEGAVLQPDGIEHLRRCFDWRDLTRALIPLIT
jgi:hypothetical protein